MAWYRALTTSGGSPRRRATTLAVVVTLAVGCGGAEAEAAPTCLGEEVAVGDGWVSPVGTGRSKTDSYEVSTLLFDTSEGDRIVMENFAGAMAGIPATAMPGYLVFSGHRVDLVDDDVPPPDGAIGPCLRLEVSELPADWEPPGLHEEDASH